MTQPPRTLLESLLPFTKLEIGWLWQPWARRSDDSYNWTPVRTVEPTPTLPRRRHFGMPSATLPVGVADHGRRDRHEYSQ